MLLPLENADYFIRVLHFGVPIPAFIRLNNDDTYSMYLNADCPEKWMDAYEHELMHISNDDIYKECDIREIEEGLRDD